ncbi:hypothetical protein HDG40_002071 [Paraburkholderia sp. JPY158]|uniref:Uncharacterized protein n=1 Tax=Paraburkholderia atlantica TaxID=2654982 RepID=A0A7W8V5L2_PARAM|nr:hypothetical protein [Paraburkholderia atlantica]
MKRVTPAPVEWTVSRIHFQKKPKIDLLVWQGLTFL